MDVRCEPLTRPCRPRRWVWYGQRLDVPRHRVVGFVAVHVHAQAALRRQLAQQLHALRAVGHGALEVRNAADHFDAEVQRALQVVQRTGRAQHAVLRKRNQLQIEVRGDSLLDFQQGLHRQQARIAHVDVGANRQQSLGHRPVAISQRALDDGLESELRLELAPQRDALQQRAALIDARQPVGQRRVHVEMGVDERRRHELAGRIERLARSAGDARPTSTIRPSWTAMSMPVRPSGRLAFLIRRSSMGSSRLDKRAPALRLCRRTNVKVRSIRQLLRVFLAGRPPCGDPTVEGSRDCSEDGSQR